MKYLRITQWFCITSLALVFLVSCSSDKELETHRDTSTKVITIIEHLQPNDISIIVSKVENFTNVNPEASVSEVEEFTRIQLLEFHDSLKAQYLPTVSNQLNSEEAKLCLTSLYNCLKTYQASNEALSRAPQYFSDGAVDGRQDAFRHAYWNALMTRNISRDWAYKFSTAHEFNQSGLDVTMDIRNNIKGQSYGVNYPKSSYSDTYIQRKIRDGLLAGNLWIIKNSQLVQSNQ